MLFILFILFISKGILKKTEKNGKKTTQKQPKNNPKTTQKQPKNNKMNQEKECIKCGNYFYTWEDQEMCEKCAQEESSIGNGGLSNEPK